MGYCVTLQESNFRITSDKVKELCSFFNKDIYDLREIFSEYRFTIDIHKGSIVDIDFEGEKLWFYEFLERVAPFVENESYLQFLGEDGGLFRYYFRNGKVEEIQPKIFWSLNK